MYMDKNLVFSDQQAITATALGTVKPGLDVVRDIGKSNSLFVVMIVTQTFLAAGAATLDIDLVAANNSALTGNVIVEKMTPAPIPKATLVQGFKRVQKIDPGTYDLFIGLNYTVATGPFTQGAITSFITDKPEDWRSYNDPI